MISVLLMLALNINYVSTVDTISLQYILSLQHIVYAGLSFSTPTIFICWDIFLNMSYLTMNLYVVKCLERILNSTKKFTKVSSQGKSFF